LSALLQIFGVLDRPAWDEDGDAACAFAYREYAPPAPVVAAPLSPSYPAEVVPQVYAERAPAYGLGYGAPLAA
jgi:hypothetical protein